MITLGELLASGELAPVSARRFQDALRPMASGDELRAATAAFLAGCDAFRGLFENLMGGKYPFGVSFLGRLWDDKRVLGLAHAYEPATHHRRPPVRFGSTGR